VADADEAVGDHVEQEATEELVDVEVHDLHAVPVGVVAPAEADAAVGEGNVDGMKWLTPTTTVSGKLGVSGGTMPASRHDPHSRGSRTPVS
jgi:hypothetical protein